MQKLNNSASTGNFMSLLENLQDSDSDSHASISQNPPSAFLRSSTQGILQTRRGLANIYKWNVQFGDVTQIISVHGFLERVEELAKARNVSEEKIFESSIELFTSKVLISLRSNRDRFNDWRSLSGLFKKHYHPADYRQRLFQDIMNRTQDTTESIIHYLTCVKSMFRRYGNVDGNAMLNIISRNLALFYSTQLSYVTSLRELEDACLQLELKKYRADNYLPPSRRKQNYVDPEFVFVSCGDTSRSVNAISDDSPKPSTSTERSSSACWDCQKVAQNCPKPKNLVCFRCGKLNVTVRTCPKCSSGNASKRN